MHPLGESMLLWVALSHDDLHSGLLLYALEKQHPGFKNDYKRTSKAHAKVPHDLVVRGCQICLTMKASLPGRFSKACQDVAERERCGRTCDL